jgi:SET domain-containing protein
MTEDGERGIGVYTKSRFKKGAVLGWYAGEIKPSDYGNENSDYLLEVKIGPITDASDVPSYPPDSLPHSNTVLIDAAHKGNWTRFINHSCNAYAIFHQTRVGDTTVMIVEAVRDVPAGVELTVNYGLDYYGPKSKRVCHCGADNCVGTQRRALREKRSMIDLEMRKKRVKRCKRVCPDEK